MLTRRQLLERTSLLALLPAGRLAPVRLGRPRAGGRRLVVIELEGGNDGLNTVVPFRDPAYRALRPTLALAEEELLALTPEVALHPACKTLAAQYEAGRLAIVQGVGYAEPSLSHFLSRAVWHHARRAPGEHDGNGWLGRALDEARAAGRPDASAVFVGKGPPPVAVRGRRSSATSLDGLEDFVLAGALEARTGGESGAGDPREAVARSQREALETVQRLAAVAEARGMEYPTSEIGTRLALVAQLLEAGYGASVLYTAQSFSNQGGYDTHALQARPQSALLSELSAALGVFLADLERMGRADEVVVLVFSEFGRAPAENDSRGTDHGTSGPVLLVGKPVAGGIVGAPPSLTELVGGQLAWQHDFRSLYAGLLDGWLGVPAERVLGPGITPLALLGA